MDEQKLFEKLEKITKLLAMTAVQGKNFREQVKILSDLGLTPSEIAEITGKTVNTISVTKNLIKKSKEVLK
jgi:hypothetical protein